VQPTRDIEIQYSCLRDVRIEADHARGPTAGRPGQISIEIIFVPTSRPVITSQDIRREWMHVKVSDWTGLMLTTVCTTSKSDYIM
jgi:hypothetical protein